MYQKFGKVKKRRLLLEGESRELLVYIGVGVRRIGREKLSISPPWACRGFLEIFLSSKQIFTP